MAEFAVGDKVKYIADFSDFRSYHSFDGRAARVAEIDTGADAVFPIGIRFSYNPVVYPVNANELVKIGEDDD